jgi:hypothetical protein
MSDPLITGEVAENYLRGVGEWITFEELKEKVKLLPSNKRKIILLIEEKTKWDQAVDNSISAPGDGYKTFSEKCQLEIDKYKELMKLQEVPSAMETSEVQCPKCENEERKRGRNLDRTTLFMDVIFEKLNVKAHAKELREVISFVTGYSPNTIKDYLNNPGKKVLDLPNAHAEDLIVTKKQLRKLGLLELAERIDEKFK